MHRVIFILLGVVVLSACHTDRWKDDPSDNVDIRIFRYDRLQYEATVLNSLLAWQKMNTEWSHATRLLIEDVLEIGSVDQPDIYECMNVYFSDTALVDLMEDVNRKFKDLSEIENSLTKGFRKLKEELPLLPVPRVYSQISALNQSVVVADSLLGVSLDKYMEADYPLYKQYYHSYQRYSMSPERIVPDCLIFYLQGQYTFAWEEGHRTLSDVIMYRGKIAWIVEHVLGAGKLGSLALGYTDEELEWCRKNKNQLWKWMSDNHHLASTDPMIIRYYTSSYPGYVFLTQQMPPGIGIWLGMNLSDIWMKKHKGATIADLLACTDFEDILSGLH